MKRITLFLFAGLLSTAVLAQKDDSSLHFGLKAAPSIAWLRTDSKGFSSDGSKFGFTYGLITEFNFSDHYAFATGVDVAYRGGKLKSISSIRNGAGTADSVITTVASKNNIQFVEIPLTLKLKTNEIGYLTYFLQFGISPGLNIRARSDVTITTQTVGGSTNSGSSTDNDIKSDINSFNLSMIIGGGVEYTLSGSTVLLAGLQFNNGFLDVFDASNLKANSNYLALTIGILF